MAQALALLLPAALAPADERALPDLGLDTYVGRCLSIIEQEVTELSDRASLTRPPRRDVLLAAVGTRRLAARLLENAELGGSDASLHFIAGFTH